MTFKQEVLRMLSLEKNKWRELQGKEQNVTHENFVNDVILILSWIMNDIENLKEG